MSTTPADSEKAPTAWTPEPWDATLNGTFHHQGLYIGEVDDPENPKPGYASDRDVANAQRLVECVNALAGIHYPAATPRALKALSEIVAGLRRDLRTLPTMPALSPELMGTLIDAETALAEMQNGPH